MLCEKCGLNEAQTHYKTVVNGKVDEHHYCNSCAAELLGGQISGPSGFFGAAFPDPFANMLGNLFSARPEQTVAACPTCRKGIREISATGRMGCSGCYGHFEKELSPYISRLHGVSAHAGKLPRSCSAQRVQAREISRLKNELNRAVEAQEYERAAGLRDKINQLEKEAEA
jgi:protein arginine kinase activator